MEGVVDTCTGALVAIHEWHTGAAGGPPPPEPEPEPEPLVVPSSSAERAPHDASSKANAARVGVEKQGLMSASMPDAPEGVVLVIRAPATTNVHANRTPRA
jgi:hypothetical protein